jgi:RimJ/RimL family protein N-acetyltransferase
MAFVEPVTLPGNLVELTPLEEADHDGLVTAASDGDLWTLFYTGVPRPEQMGEAVGRLLAQRESGSMMPFVVRRTDTGDTVGMTSFCNIDADNRRLEIGYTWYARSAQGTGVNAESKLLLLTHAFETLGCIAVELRTHWLNRQSRGAIERLGAKQDGVLRSHRILADGSVRDTVVYSIIEHEWPAVRNELRRRLDVVARGHEAGDTPRKLPRG